MSAVVSTREQLQAELSSLTVIVSILSVPYVGWQRAPGCRGSCPVRHSKIG